MSANILVIEYEPRYVEHVRRALSGSGFRLEIAGNMDDAVNRCANFEPTVVLITSVLPNLKIEDAITQLRARAGLRVTPFLILMSGYRGEQPKQDALRYGAQDILERPFGAEALRSRVEELVLNAPNPAATQAIPKEMLEKLRRSAGLGDGEKAVTSDDLFGEILSDMEGGEQQPIKAPGEPTPPPAATAKPAAPAKSSVDDALAEMLRADKNEPRPRRQTSTDEEVEKLLSDTLSGLEIAALRKAPAAPADKKPAAGPPQRTATPPPSARADSQPPKPPQKPTAPPAVNAPPAPRPPQSLQPPQPPKAAPQNGPVGAPKRTPATRSGGEFGQYVIEKHIATGGMADVYKARMMGMEGFQKTVAIKRILSNLTDSDEFVRMFIDEAKLAAQLSHNNIIHIYDLGKIDRSHYIAMEFIEGWDLRSILEECRNRGITMPIELALYITTLLASALDYAHKKRDFDNQALGLVHRDVSPQNVLISFEGDVKLCDFGIAKAASKASQTRAGALKGKLQYMSPEQAWGKDIDHRSDIFSLGLVLFEMLTSEKVFTGTSELSVLEQVRDPIITAASMKNPEVDAEIDRIAFLALNAERDNRYQSAEEMQRDLERIMRKKRMSPDRGTIATFLKTLGAGVEIPPEPAGAPAATPATPAPKPVSPSPPPARTAASSAKAPPPEKRRESLFAPNDELEFGLSSRTKGVPPVFDLDGHSSGVSSKRVRKDGGNQRLWMLLGLLALVVVAAGGWWIFFSGGSSEGPPIARAAPVTPLATETPAAEPTVGLMSEKELIERAREVAAAEITKQEEELRQRLEQEFPTPTPIPPTPTPTETETPPPSATPTPPPTATPVPPTATPIPPTPTPSVREGDIVVRGPGVVPPVVLYREEPKYPPMAEKMRVTGMVEADALVGIDGSVEEVRITRVEGQKLGFEAATEAAIKNWRYRPATKDGIRVRMWVTIRVPFRLQ
jgi:TonB family protein